MAGHEITRTTTNNLHIHFNSLAPHNDINFFFFFFFCSNDATSLVQSIFTIIIFVCVCDLEIQPRSFMSFYCGSCS